ncbi:MAG: transcriptional regulator with GAF, ATPase, and Fis domain [Mariniblastus sp.]|jgi:transcriptional regulator with GAF, ATPase, and Fis domain
MVNSTKPQSAANIAYLVIRDGKKWSDVFRLLPSRTVTIGRSPNNQIVIKEDQASRQHAEIFMSEGNWTVRDLNSRNGTAIGDSRVTGDHTLKPGNVIWIAGTQLSFVTDLSTAYNRKVFSRVEIGAETITGLEIDDSEDEGTIADLKLTEPTQITHRRQKTRYLQKEDSDDLEVTDVAEGEKSKASRNATRLCRLAFDLANETTPRAIARMAIDCLHEETNLDAGAVLMVPKTRRTTVDPEKLEILAWRSVSRPEYQRVSKFLAETCLRNAEAILARDIQDDSALGLRDSEGTIHATSVIAAPIKMNNRTIGLIHLYSTNAAEALRPHDLEFTLAVAETVGMALRTRYREQKLVEDLTKTRTQIDQLRNQLGVESEIIGASAEMFRVHEQVSKAAPSRATILVRGESGVGKELVARAVHFSSDRRGGPFVCLNCAALSESLLESELFGHEKGAFTGATDRKAGKFETADKGTLMLDEIGEMSQSIQAKFLRVLEGHPFERVGGSKAIKVDVRVIAATNRDLEEEVRRGKFRKDLFFRLHVVQIDVPPLRKRPEDIPELAAFFLQKYNLETSRRITGFSPQAQLQLQRYRWPGNVRELKNVIERAVVLARGNIIELDELILTNLSTASESQFDAGTLVQEYRPESLEIVEQRHIEATLRATAWNKSKSAAILGVERSTLDRKIKKYGIRKDT